jgi:hypothetical protein
MPAIVVGERRSVEGRPGELSQASLERARKALAERNDDKKDDQTTPIPPPPEGFGDPVWNKKEFRWMTCASNEEKWRIWYKEKWYTWEDYERCRLDPLVGVDFAD